MFIPPNAESQLEPKQPLKNPILQPSGAIPRLKVRFVNHRLYKNENSTYNF